MIGWRSRRIGAWATAVRIGPLGACSRELDCGCRLTTPHRYAERPRRPKNLCLDKGYDYEQPEQEARARGVKPHIRRRGEPALTGPIRGKKPRRWVVERTNSWHNNFRALRIQIEENRGSLSGICSPRLRSHHVSGGRSIMNGFCRLALLA